MTYALRPALARHMLKGSVNWTKCTNAYCYHFLTVVNSSELSTYAFKKGAIIQFSSVVGTRQKVKPELGRIQKGKGVTTRVKRASRLQETTKIKVAPFPGYYA